MREIDGKKYYVLNEVAGILDIPYTTLYLRVREDEERVEKGKARRFPTPLKHGRIRLWEEKEIVYLEIAKQYKVKRGYGSSYKKLRERVTELEEEVLRLGGAV